MTYDCYCDGEAPSVFSKTEHTARKPHQCSECRRAIQPGERYEKNWGVWDGDAQTYKHCPRCLALIAHVEAHVKCVCWIYGDVLCTAMEEADGYKHESPEFAAEVTALIAACRNAPAFTSQLTGMPHD